MCVRQVYIPSNAYSEEENRHMKGLKRPKWKPYMVAYALLYGEFTWLERHPDGSITIPVRKMCTQLKLRATQLKEMLEWLEGIGGLSMLKWNGHWALVKTSVPKGMCRNILIEKEDEKEYVIEAITKTLERQYGEHEDNEAMAEGES